MNFLILILQEPVASAVAVQSTASLSSIVGEATSENDWSTKSEQSHIEQIANRPSLPQSSLHLPNELSTSSSTIVTPGDLYYDIDLETCSPDSPGSPAEECDYTRPIEIASTTASSTTILEAEEGQLVSQASSRASSGCSLSSMDFYDPENGSESETLPKSSLTLSIDYYDCDDVKGIDAELQNGQYYPQQLHHLVDSDSCSESLPNSQSTSLSTFNANNSSSSNNTLQDEAILELCMLSKEQYLDEIDGFSKDLQPQSLPPSDWEHIEYPRMADHVIEASPEPEPENKNAVPSSNGHDQLTVVLPHNDMEYAQEPQSLNHSEEDNFVARPQRVRRCSSLKTGKTPPGTPGRKKYVRFADVLGLDLADVKTFMDEIPVVPRSAYEDLLVTPDDDSDDVGINETDSSPFGGPSVQKILVPLFLQPGGVPGFLDLVREQSVCLENVMVTDPICLTISGTVRVRNLDFNKSVHVRYTLDSWQTYSDFQAMYIPNSCDGFSDKFSFTIFGNSLQIGQRIEMAVRFSCKGDHFWDSNSGANYCFQCMPANSMLPPIASVVPNITNNCEDLQGITPAALSNAQNMISGTFY